LASAETARDDSRSYQCTTLTQKSPARCRDNILIDVDWSGHGKSSVRKQRAHNAAKPTYIFEARHPDCNQRSKAPFAEDCCACGILADLIAVDRNRA